jgi:hypothetical protein
MELICDCDGLTKIRIVGEKKNPSVKMTSFESGILKIFKLILKKKKRKCMQYPPILKKRKPLLINSTKKTQILIKDNIIIRQVEERNEDLRKIVILKNRPDGLKRLQRCYFFRSTNGKVLGKSKRIDEMVEKIDPVMEKKRVRFWDEQVGATFSKKIISKEEKKMLQEKVDRLEIIKGFSKAVWQYCMFTPEDYEKKKEKLKITWNYSEIFIPKIFMEELGKRFDGLYGAYCITGEIKFENQEHYNIAQRYRMNSEREGILENGDIIKYHEVKVGLGTLVKPEWVFSPQNWLGSYARRSN